MIPVVSGRIRSRPADSSIVTDSAFSRTPQASYAVLVSLGLLTIALGYAVFKNGGTGLMDWNLSLLIIGLAGFAFLRTPLTSRAPSMQPWLRWAVLLFPCYVAFQLIPLPLALMRILSPERVQLFESVRNLVETGGLVPLSIAPATTFTYFFRIAGYTLTFLLIRDITARSSEERAWWPTVPLVAVAGMEALLGFLHNSDTAQVQGTYANKNHFAGLLEMVLPIAVMYAIALLQRGVSRRARSHWRTVKGGAVFSLAALIFLGLLYSMSKMGLVSGLFGLFVMGALAVGAANVQLWKKCIAATALAVFLLFVFVFFPPDELIQAFGGLVSNTGPNTEGRLPIWNDTLRLIGAYPLFGCGLGNFETAFLRYQTAVVDRDFTFAHNDYLELAAELGAIGIIIVASLILPIVLRAVRAATRGPDRNTRYIGLGCVGGITAIGLHSLADFNMYIPANAMLLAWLCGISAGLPSRSVHVAAREPVPNEMFFRRFAIAISCLLVAFAPAWILFEIAFRSDMRAESSFCRFGICDTDAVLAAQTLEHGGKISAVPVPQRLEAVRRDAAAPQRWCDLGSAMLKAGETGRARYCFSRALVFGPNIPFILVQAGDFHFSLTENREALELMARALSLDAGYQEVVFDDYEQKGIRVDEVLEYGLPRDPRVSREYLRRLLNQKRASDAVKTWEWIVSRKYADDKLADEYVEFLTGKKEYEAAVQAWAHYAWARDKGYPTSNTVFNGDFESDPSGSRFDWTLDPEPGAAVDFDRAVHYSGARSLRIRLDGTQNVSNIGVRQSVFLKPGRYRFAAYVRTQEISTDEGVAFSVVDPEEPKRLSFGTENMVGSSDWKLVQHVFQVQPGTGLIKVTLVRKPSWKFDNLIRGTVWVDEVSIRPETGYRP